MGETIEVYFTFIPIKHILCSYIYARFLKITNI